MYEISVIIPVYNVDNYLNISLKSIINQDFDMQYEIIIVNDGSTDSSPNICRRFADKYDNIKLINQENRGVNIARNVGIKAASGRYVMFMDGDDTVETFILSSLYRAAADNPEVNVVFGGCARIFDSTINVCNYPSYVTGKVMTRDETVDFFLLNAHTEKNLPLVSPWSKLFKKDFLIANNIKFPESIAPVGGDECFMIEVVDKSENNCFIEQSLYNLTRTRLDSIMNFFMYNKRYLFAKYMQNDYSLNYLQSMDISAISDFSVEFYKERLQDGFLSVIYSRLQQQILKSLVVSDKFDYEIHYLFYGDFFHNTLYYNALPLDCENASFVCNQSLDYGKHIGSYKVISLDEAVKKKNIAAYKIIITDCINFNRCFLELFNRGLVNRYRDVMICDTKIPIEQWYEEGLALICGHLMYWDLERRIKDEKQCVDGATIDEIYNSYKGFYDYVDTKDMAILTELKISEYRNKISDIYSGYVNNTHYSDDLTAVRVKRLLTSDIADVGGIRQYHELLSVLIKDGVGIGGNSKLINKVTSLYLDIQLNSFFELMFFNNESRCDTVMFFGASSLCQQYIRLAKSTIKNIYLFDNDKSKHGSTLLGYTIESPEQLKHYRAKRGKIIITSMYFLEISKQMLQMGIVDNMNELMLNKGKTEIEKLFIKVFALL